MNLQITFIDLLLKYQFDQLKHVIVILFLKGIYIQCYTFVKVKYISFLYVTYLILQNKIIHIFI